MCLLSVVYVLIVIIFISKSSCCYRWYVVFGGDREFKERREENRDFKFIFWRILIVDVGENNKGN